MLDISSLKGSIIGRDVTDEDFKEFKPLPPNGFYTKEQWEERRKELLKIKLP